MKTKIISCIAVLLLAGCSLPRGAAIEEEIIARPAGAERAFSVVEVTRASLAQIANWPASGGPGPHNWLGADRPSAPAVLRAGDVIDLTIWDSQPNSLLTTPGQKTVNMPGLRLSPDGAVFLPYVGDVVLAGLSPDRARARLQDALGEIAPDAQVQITLKPGRASTVDLVGGVATPGSYSLGEQDLRILGLLAQGGGISRALRNPLVRLMRDGQRYEIRADALLSEPARNIVMQGGDQVVVEEDKRFFTALGATGSEQLVYFDRERITALEALSLIGGLAEARANPKGVLILREYPQSAVRADPARGPDMAQVVFSFDLTHADGLFAARNFTVNPGDTVLATESPVNAAKAVIGLIGSLFDLGNKL